MKLIGPFTQILTMRNLPMKGTIKDEQLELIENGGIIVENGFIRQVGNYKQLREQNPAIELEEINTEQVVLPGFVDSHTHICYGGNRAKDFAMRLNGKTYLEIAESGGGIWSTVTQTRSKSPDELKDITLHHIDKLIAQGITTAEVKSGYALSVEGEKNMLQAIGMAKQETPIEVVTTFLGAHMKPKDFEGSNRDYLEHLVQEIFPVLRKEYQCNRVDIFVEQSAFSIEEGDYYMNEAKKQGFELTIHADQFTAGASQLAVKYQALSADHLEFSGKDEIMALSQSDVVATVLPGASIGLGMQYAPARKLLDANCCVSIASDWNPGSAPMGNLLTQASILATFEKLSMAEVLSAITFRAAKALNFSDRGIISEQKIGDFISFSTSDFRNIIYEQGQLQPTNVWKDGRLIYTKK
ncbi:MULTISPECIES: imidazolonepropionase [Weeksella]|uniref:Imidazolonepropionase n=1 Tax=Weeksella virosa (strain ATCC 43766 / DSM 16922 / JCM 21250 / CCUG 30538 / CDC 9751 / IAM 14551 / NBRC 16016 / NCTC 11634 / CL345/78) TaxID=865938 RepID=F0NYH8_WEEVC|nr:MULTISPECIES: imidazolonepropionase [Weeksella]ADX67098.1 imidazolonepropionase [Weeksella virosa DSM 16922]MDK7375660.1 imidazolonepropionase [Weeksella virosa]MDK7675025.1 imidazolonepropionase [Weeksella virosa]OFM82379.1 imidazolonepropionase [Weeksella sp. HMSC059D05]SUP53369.1 Imidazolonepropionase [Weeksella virosa]